MFTWICPQCGREVPPSYDECPDCKERAAAAQQAAPLAAAPVPDAPPPASMPAQAPPPYQPAPAVTVRPYAPPPPSASSGLPVWLLTVVFALAILGVVAGVVWTVGYFHGRETKPSATVESPAAKPGTATNPLQRFIEISGVRFAADPKHKGKTDVRFVLTNHSDAEIQGAAGNVTVWANTRKSDEEAVGTFTFQGDLKPMESREISAPLNTKMKIYELPDWQNVTTDIQITAPAPMGGK